MTFYSASYCDKDVWTAGAGLQIQHPFQSQVTGNPCAFMCCIEVVPNEYFMITCTHHLNPAPPITILHVANGYS